METLIIVLIAAAAWFWWRFPRWQLQKFHPDIIDAAERADAEDKFRRTLGQVLGGGAILAGLVLTFVEIEDARKASRAQVENLSKQQVTQQFSKAVELLGEQSLAERLGGIYSLQQVAQQSEDYYGPVMETLTAYVRNAEPSKAEDIWTFRLRSP
jgi:hypothetical protein